MNFKKLLSLAAATAIAAGSFAAMAVTASAAVEISGINTYSETTTFNFENEDLAELSIEKNGSKALNNGLYYYAGGTANGYSITTAPVENAGYTKAFNGANGDTGKAVLVFKAGAAGKVSAKFSSTTVGDSMRIYNGSNNDFSVAAANTIESTAEVTVAKDATVYISSRNTKNRVSIYEITYTVATDEPVVETKYSISVADGIENGSVSINGDVTEAAKGATVNVTATPANGFVLDEITVNGTSIEGTSFTMPEEAVVVSATFKEYVAPTFDDLPLDTAITFADDGYKTYINLASEAAVNDNKVTFNGTTYTQRLYFSGAMNSSHPDRYVTFTPAVDGILEVIAQGGTNTNVRPLAIQQDGFDEQSKIMPTTGDVDIYKYTVKAGVPVKMYSKNSGIGVYSIKLVETPTTTEKSYAFTKTLSDFAGRNNITVNVKGIDTQANNTFDLTREVAIGNLTGSEEAGLLIGVKLTVDDGLQINSVTIK